MSLSPEGEIHRRAGKKTVNQALYGNPQFFRIVHRRAWPFSAPLWELTAEGSAHAQREPSLASPPPRPDFRGVSTKSTIPSTPAAGSEPSQSTGAIRGDLLEEEPPKEDGQPSSNDELRRQREKVAQRNPPPAVNPVGWSALYKGAVHPGHPTFGLSDSVRDSMAKEIEPYIDSD
jgi:hypothetical protein